MVKNRDEVLAAIRSHKTELEKFGVTRIGIFGSAARDELTEKSDVDVLVEFAPGQINLTNFMGVKFLLEDTFGRKVDLATPDVIAKKNILWREVVKEVIYAA